MLCLYTECRVFIVMLGDVMPNGIMLNVAALTLYNKLDCFVSNRKNDE